MHDVLVDSESHRPAEGDFSKFPNVDTRCHHAISARLRAPRRPTAETPRPERLTI